MKTKNLFYVLAVFLFFGINSCKNDDDDGEAHVMLNLIDSSGEYEEVNVQIVEIQYNSGGDDEGWKTFDFPDGQDEIKVNLLDLVAGESELLADEVLPEGRINQIRLILGEENTILLDEDGAEPIELETPSAQQSGLKLKVNEDIEGGFSYNFILDWDVSKSIVETGNDKYILKPTINVILEANSGVIKGKITSDGINGVKVTNGVSIMLDGASEVYTTTSTNELGEFVFQGVESGMYMLKVEKDGYQNYEGDANIEVKVGETKDVGIITLVMNP